MHNTLGRRGAALACSATALQVAYQGDELVHVDHAVAIRVDLSDHCLCVRLRQLLTRYGLPRILELAGLEEAVARRVVSVKGRCRGVAGSARAQGSDRLAQ